MSKEYFLSLTYIGMEVVLVDKQRNGVLISNLFNPCSLTQALQLWPCMTFNLLAGLDEVSNEISIEKCQIESMMYVFEN